MLHSCVQGCAVHHTPQRTERVMPSIDLTNFPRIHRIFLLISFPTFFFHSFIFYICFVLFRLFSTLSSLYLLPLGFQVHREKIIYIKILNFAIKLFRAYETTTANARASGATEYEQRLEKPKKKKKKRARTRTPTHTMEMMGEMKREREQNEGENIRATK